MSSMITKHAAAGASLASDYGKVAVQTAVASGKSRCALASSAAHNSEANAPLGIIKSADAANGGPVTIVTSGPAVGKAGTTLTAGTHTALMANASGLLIPATDGNYVVAHFVGSVDAVANDLIDVDVQIYIKENS